MKDVLWNCPDHILNRASRAQQLRDKGVFYWRAMFWRVVCIDYRYGHVELEWIPHRRKSIDDCTPAEWTAANWASLCAAATGCA